MPFDRALLPDTASYFEHQALTLKGPRAATWKTTTCTFHGGSDSMRVNLATGAWVCMSCGEKGGDVLAYAMRSTGSDFVAAAKALGCWVDDGRAPAATTHDKRMPLKPTPLSPRQALSVMAFESTLAAVAACNVAHGVAMSPADRARLLVAANRINRLVEAFA